VTIACLTETKIETPFNCGRDQTKGGRCRRE